MLINLYPVSRACHFWSISEMFRFLANDGSTLNNGWVALYFSGGGGGGGAVHISIHKKTYNFVILQGVSGPKSPALDLTMLNSYVLPYFISEKRKPTCCAWWSGHMGGSQSYFYTGY